jgi:hypothetical protein
MACRGLAQVALAQGDTCQALHHYGELVSKALMGRGSAEHWAYAEYGWLLFKVCIVKLAKCIEKHSMLVRVFMWAEGQLVLLSAFASRVPLNW